MLDSLNRPYPFYDDLSYNLKAILGISLGVFLFFLFFQPVELQTFEFNNRLMVITGFGGINLGIMALCLIVIPSIFPDFFLSRKWKLYKEILFDLIIWILIAVAFNFYARYVGLVSITFEVSFRIVLSSLIPVVILIVIHQFHYLTRHLQTLIDINRKAPAQNKDLYKKTRIIIPSENKSEDMHLNLADLVMVKSANNYIEVYYLENYILKKQLIRTTLKSTEELLEKYNHIVRCHRSTLVNSDYILKLSGHQGTLKLILRDLNVEVPVSRQYLEKVKEVIN
jgi:hypothetical protein